MESIVRSARHPELKNAMRSGIAKAYLVESSGTYRIRRPKGTQNQHVVRKRIEAGVFTGRGDKEKVLRLFREFQLQIAELAHVMRVEHRYRVRQSRLELLQTWLQSCLECGEYVLFCLFKFGKICIRVPAMLLYAPYIALQLGFGFLLLGLSFLLERLDVCCAICEYCVCLCGARFQGRSIDCPMPSAIKWRAMEMADEGRYKIDSAGYLCSSLCMNGNARVAVQSFGSMMNSELPQSWRRDAEQEFSRRQRIETAKNSAQREVDALNA